MDGAGLESSQCAELLFGSAEARESLCGPRGEHTTRLGETAAAPGALDELLSCSGLEQAEVLARARLADADRRGSRRDAALPVDLDEQTHPRRVPELSQGARGRHFLYR